MKINIKDKEIELKYGFKALMIYEQITDKSFNPSGLTDMLTFFYSCFLAGGGTELNLGFDGFISYLDENPDKVNEFNQWILSINQINEQLKEKEVKVEDSSKKNEE